MRKNSIYLLVSFALVCSLMSDNIHDWARTGDNESMLAYIHNNGEIGSVDSEGRTALHYATGYGQYEVFLTLIDYAQERSIDIQDIYGRTPLHYASCIESSFYEAFGPSIVQKLIDKRAGVSTQDNRLYSPLHLAVGADNYDIVYTLLKSGANPNLCTNQGQSALHISAIIGNEKVVRLLLAFKAHTNVLDTSGHTPRDLAIINGHFEIAQLL